MAATASWVMHVPVLTTAHLTQQTIGDLDAHPADNPFAIVAPYAEGMFLYVRRELDEVPMPNDLKRLREWAQQNGHEWIRLDADGDEVDGLPLHDW